MSGHNDLQSLGYILALPNLAGLLNWFYILKATMFLQGLEKYSSFFRLFIEDVGFYFLLKRSTLKDRLDLLALSTKSMTKVFLY